MFAAQHISSLHLGYESRDERDFRSDATYRSGSFRCAFFFASLARSLDEGSSDFSPK